MISLFNFVCSCPFVTPMNYLGDEDYTGAPFALFTFPRLDGGLLIISGGIVCSYEGECSREKGTVS